MANEKRLIDADANVLKSLFYDRYDRAFMQMHSREEREYWDGVCCGVNWGLNTITDAPTVQAVEVVRCKDCRYAYINFFSANSGVALCRHWTNHAEGKQAITQHDDFCSYGERREGE